MKRHREQGAFLKQERGPVVADAALPIAFRAAMGAAPTQAVYATASTIGP